MSNDGPLIVQSDKTVLLEVDHELAGAARAAIAPFAELERAPEHVHTYRITPLALWNARAAGHDAEQVVDALVSFSRYAVPQPLLVDVVDTMARYGRLQLVKHPAHGLTLVSHDRAVLEEVLRNRKIAPMLGARIDDDTVAVHASERGRVKQMLLKIGWPATSTVKPTPSACGRTTGICATIRSWPPSRSGWAARVWWCCPAGRARHWSVRPPWPKPVPRR
jgi:DNA excision repair protein ERCC-3